MGYVGGEKPPSVAPWATRFLLHNFKQTRRRLDLDKLATSPFLNCAKIGAVNGSVGTKPHFDTRTVGSSAKFPQPHAVQEIP